LPAIGESLCVFVASRNSKGIASRATRFCPAARVEFRPVSRSTIRIRTSIDAWTLHSCAEHCGRPAASHWSRNHLPNPLAVNGRPSCVRRSEGKSCRRSEHRRARVVQELPVTGMVYGLDRDNFLHERWCVLTDVLNEFRTVDQDRRRRVDHPLGCDDAAPRLEARSAAAP
jgi:hypothetical protein